MLVYSRRHFVMDIEKGIMDELIKKIDTMEREIEELKRKLQILQDAFYRSYEDQRRRERKY